MTTYVPPILGTNWLLLAASTVAVSAPADASEDTLATITIPAGIMRLNGILRVTTHWSETGSINLKTHRVKFGGTNFVSSGNNTAAITDVGFVNYIANRNAANSQIGWGIGVGTNAGIFASGKITAAINTAADVTMLLTGQKATAGETLTLESYMVELLGLS